MKKRLRKKKNKKLIDDVLKAASTFDAQPVSMVNRMIWYDGQMYETDSNGKLIR